MIYLYYNYKQMRLRSTGLNAQEVFRCVKTTKYLCARAVYVPGSHANPYAPFAILGPVLVLELMFAYFAVLPARFCEFDRRTQCERIEPSSTFCHSTSRRKRKPKTLHSLSQNTYLETTGCKF